MSKKSQEGLPFCKKLDERSKKYSKNEGSMIIPSKREPGILFECNKRRNASATSGPKKQLKPQRERRKEGKKRPNAENSRIEFRGRLMAAEATFWHSTLRFLASLLFDAETNLDPGKQTFIQQPLKHRRDSIVSDSLRISSFTY